MEARGTQMRMKSLWLGVVLCMQCGVIGSGFAQVVNATPGATAPTTDLAAVVVSGVQPGPGLWKVSSGDHVLWILGTESPLPSGIAWKSAEVRGVLEQADQVLSAPGVQVSADIGVFRGLLMLPSIRKAMRNPDGRSLREVLPAATYARWATFKQKYIGRDADIEKKRPFLAAQELYAAAVKQAGLGGGVVSPVVSEVLKRRKLQYTPTSLKFTIQDPKQALAEFRKESLGGQEAACLEQTMDRIERDLPQMRMRANAWAMGDLETLRSMPRVEAESCWSAWAETQTMRSRGISDVQARTKAHWLEVANGALARNRVSFALLPMADLLAADGFLAPLRAKGYTVEAPE